MCFKRSLVANCCAKVVKKSDFLKPLTACAFSLFWEMINFALQKSLPVQF